MEMKLKTNNSSLSKQNALFSIWNKRDIDKDEDSIYSHIYFKFEKEIGHDILMVENLSKEGYFKNLSFTVQRDEKIGIVADKSTTLTMLYDILMGKELPEEGSEEEQVIFRTTDDMIVGGVFS